MKKSLMGNAVFVALGLTLTFWPLSGYQEGIIVLLCIN